MDKFGVFLLSVWGVVCLILFFKIWRMTDDIHAIREKISPKPKNTNTDRFANVPASWDEVEKKEKGLNSDKDFNLNS